MVAECHAPQTRAHDAAFVQPCSLSGLQTRLPLRWPTPPDVLPCPKRTFRSHYRYLGYQDLLDPAAWEFLSDFDLVVRLVDFSGLRPVLAQRLGWASGRGWCPFDPVSLFLLLGWQITHGWSRAETLRNLHRPRYADYAQRFGFHDGLYPTEGGLRYFLTALGCHSEVVGDTVCVKLDDERTIEVAVQFLNQLLAGAVALVRQADLLSPQAWNQALVCPDGMLHDAASRPRCTSVQDSCYQPTTPQQLRPCPAKEKGRQGCSCDALACAQVCQYATPRDAAARFVYYEGHNAPPTSPNALSNPAEPPKRDTGRRCYGYRSLPLLLADPARRFHLTLLADFHPANDREEIPAAALLLQLARFYPDLHLHAVAGDAGFGFDVVLHTVYHLHALRVIDLRAHATDQDKSLWPLRGYDDKGRPLCPFGYPLSANGFDARRHRHKWACLHTCLHGTPPRVLLDGINHPPLHCPYLAPDHPHGRIVNIGERFPDSSIRLVRDLPVGTPAWKRLYHRARNASEGRHATLERWNLKRLPVYGQPRAKALAYLADSWATLTTLARLVREATTAAPGP